MKYLKFITVTADITSLIFQHFLYYSIKFWIGKNFFEIIPQLKQGNENMSFNEIERDSSR